MSQSVTQNNRIGPRLRRMTSMRLHVEALRPCDCRNDGIISNEKSDIYSLNVKIMVLTVVWSE